MDGGQSAGHDFGHEACAFEGDDVIVGHRLVFGGVLCLGGRRTEVDVALVGRCAGVVLVVAVGRYVEFAALDAGVAEGLADVLEYPVDACLEVERAQLLAAAGGECYGHVGVEHPFAAVAHELVGYGLYEAVGRPCAAVIAVCGAVVFCGARSVVQPVYILHVVGCGVGSVDVEPFGEVGLGGREVGVGLAHCGIVGRLEHGEAVACGRPLVVAVAVYGVTGLGGHADGRTRRARGGGGHDLHVLHFPCTGLGGCRFIAEAYFDLLAGEVAEVDVARGYECPAQ